MFGVQIGRGCDVDGVDVVEREQRRNIRNRVNAVALRDRFPHTGKRVQQTAVNRIPAAFSTAGSNWRAAATSRTDDPQSKFPSAWGFSLRTRKHGPC